MAMALEQTMLCLAALDTFRGGQRRRQRKFIFNKQRRGKRAAARCEKRARKQQEMLRVAAWQEETFDELF